jgi:CheY-like chemotaxis protein
MGSRMKSRVLFVDDDPDYMHLLAYALRSGGYEPLPAFGGEDAITKTERSMPDLVITDLAMPNVTGVEVIYVLKHNPQTEHIPVLAVTAYIWDSIARAANQAGCDGYIKKPFRSRDLVAKVEQYLASVRS